MLMSHSAAQFAVKTPAVESFSRKPLLAAVLSARPARLMASLGRLGIRAIDATRADLALLLGEAPDMLIVDIEPGSISARRLALLVAELGWVRKDLVVAVAAGRTAALSGMAYDMTFDATASDASLDASFAEAGHIHALSRLRSGKATRPSAQPAPALLRRAAAPRRAQLFR